MTEPKLYHERGFWLFGDKETIEREHMDDPPLCEGLLALFGRGSVVDFGCGTGAYVKAFCAAGLEAYGYDGNPHTPEMTGGLCKVLDLSRPVNLGFTVVNVMSLEVGEHIPVAYEDTFILNLVNHCEHTLVLSWAVPEKEKGLGLGHVNCRTNFYIENRLRLWGFKRDVTLELPLRKMSCHRHFKDTLMVYHRQERM